MPVQTLQSQFDGKTTLVWADNTDGNSSPSPKEVVARLTAKFTPVQRAAVKEVNASDIFASCPQNWRGFTQCFAAVEFADIPSLNESSLIWVNYTIYGDFGLEYINVEKHTSDFEHRILPLQWEIDKVRSPVLTSDPWCGTTALYSRPSSKPKHTSNKRRRWNGLLQSKATRAN